MTPHPPYCNVNNSIRQKKKKKRVIETRGRTHECMIEIANFRVVVFHLQSNKRQQQQQQPSHSDWVNFQYRCYVKWIVYALIVIKRKKI